MSVHRHVMPLMALVALLMSDAFASVYRWVDEQGRVHYGDKPPPGAEALNPRLPLIDGPAAAPTAGDAADPTEPAAADCDGARSDLFRFEKAARLMREGADGEPIELSDAERDEFLALQRARVRSACADGEDEP